MAYLYEDIATTQKGSIIYKRKKHFFGPKDLHRIIKTVPLPREDEKQFWWLLAALDMVEQIARLNHADVADSANELLGVLITYISSAEKFEGFSGGRFGGGGAGGTWWRPFPISGKLPSQGDT